ncbi:MAG: MGH1-like glycoside hydrolase domain-containing protein, partial [Syntrophothermus sp.]
KLVSAILGSAENSKRAALFVKGVAGCRSIHVAPGERTSLRMVIHLRKDCEKINHPLIKKIMDIDEESLIRDDEKIFQNIPALKGISRDQQIFYQSCFSLMRQCMMPQEGECKTNYYVFSREPRWGWGYGGQVFHESLAMLAYVFMDPKGAMDSQRIYMQRQHDNGYINYRTGPYLNESIPYDSTFTSSAPWYNYENYEIYKITKDRAFLKEAYESGKKFYEFYVASRDSNSNGLCEWGGEASLESVRDARVAVWDQVGWPSNFEGPDVNSMLVMEAKSLEKMAKELGLEQESKKWKKDWEQRADKINWFMWDESTGLYYNINRNNQSFTFRKDNDLKIKEIIGFLPYWAGIPDSAQVERLMQVMKDSAEFWRPNGISTLSAKESYYNPIGYWNGPVWVQWNYLLFRGMLDHGDTTGAKILVSRVINTMIWHLKNDHTFWEFYSPDDHQAGWNQTYIWAGIAARFLIDLHDNQ